jgi:hypothetical protein
MNLEEQLEHPDRANELGVSLPTSDFILYEDGIVNMVCEDSFQSYLACWNWAPDRFEKHGYRLAEAVAKSARQSWMAISYLPDKRFNPFATRFFDGVAKDWSVAGLDDNWPLERVNMRSLYEWGGVNEHLLLLTEAYGNCGGQWKKFSEGLKQVKPEDQGKWAQYIIDHFKKDTIGGGNYREVFG